MNNQRICFLNQNHYKNGKIMYWMQREHRVYDNWALLYAQEQAEKYNAVLEVVFCLRPQFETATERLISFMFDGLKEVEKNLHEKNICFTFLLGDPVIEIPKFIHQNNGGMVITEFHSLKLERRWREKIAQNVLVPVIEVDARNIVPCRIASTKQEYAARTFRPKIHTLLPTFLDEFTTVKKQTHKIRVQNVEWEKEYEKIQFKHDIKKVKWLKAGAEAAHTMLHQFISEKLHTYVDKRNDPAENAQSYLSSYLHFGHISAQRVVLELQKIKSHQLNITAFIEELVVRRELSDNYCFYNKNYDNSKGFPSWATLTLQKHVVDRRDFLYTFEELAASKTHDEIWNAAMKEAKMTGIMHGYLRMYWAKKILEWSESAAEAQQKAISLMDLYFLDGRDSNGFTGIAWSMGGVHDRPWFERAIFGMVRYMSYTSLKKKFNLQEYISRIEKDVNKYLFYSE